MQRNAEQIDTRIETKTHSFDGVSWTFGLRPETPQVQSHAANDDVSQTARSALPSRTAAFIHKPDRGPGMAGKAGACDWVLTFQPCSAQFIEPLMGWYGGEDPLRHVTLRFPTREAAVGYAERHGLAYEVSEPPPERRASASCPDDANSLWAQWMHECLGSFDLGAHWWGNAGADDRLIATLDRLNQSAHAVGAPAHTPTSSGMPVASANADARPEVGDVNAA